MSAFVLKNPARDGTTQPSAPGTGKEVSRGRRAAAFRVLPRSALLAFATVLLFGGVAVFWSATIDDAFISYQYARNWAQDAGLTFNPGERVEGFSNFLWVALLGGAAKLGLDPVVMAKVLGLLALLLLIGLSLRFLIISGFQGFAPAATLLLLAASNWALTFLAVTGLETVFFAALLVGVLVALRAAGNRLTTVSALLLLLVALTRPEGILYGVSVALGLLWLNGRPDRRTAVLWLAITLAYGLLLAARWRYFGSLVPNTFFAKPSPVGWVGLTGLLVTAWNAVPELAGFFARAGGPLTGAMVGLAVMAPERRRLLLPSAVVVMVGFGFQIYAGKDWMELGRFLVPIWAPVVLLAIVGWHEVAAHLETRPRRLAVAFWLGLTLLFNVHSGVQFWNGRGLYPTFVLTSEDMVSASKWIGQRYPSTYSVVCWRIGALGYYSNLTVIDDTWGLTDTYIARLRHENQLTPEARDEYLASRNPELLLLYAAKDAQPLPQTRIGGRDYLFVRRFPQGTEEWWDLYQRTDL